MPTAKSTPERTTAPIPLVDYQHSRNVHTVQGSESALPALLRRCQPKSLLDIGCGRGTWLRAAASCGIHDLTGIDGVAIPVSDLLFPKERFVVRDVSRPFDLGRNFDLALCLEVAEHLPEERAEQLICNIVRHADGVLFSAACPAQPGQHHVNCQWPDYWQSAFNQHGYVCSDWPRWLIWADRRIEPWYRQNMFFAEKRPELAGKEHRIPAVLHPDFLQAMTAPQCKAAQKNQLSRIEAGKLPGAWYAKICGRALWRKALRRLSILATKSQ